MVNQCVMVWQKDDHELAGSTVTPGIARALRGDVAWETIGKLLEVSVNLLRQGASDENS